MKNNSIKMVRRKSNIKENAKCSKKTVFIAVTLTFGILSTLILFLVADKQQTKAYLKKSSNFERKSFNLDGTKHGTGRRWNSLAEASSEIQKRLHYIMNPKNCSKAKKFYCKWNGRRCGFGCLTHRMTPCLSLGYKTQRTVYLDLDGQFANTGGYEKWFKPLSTCRKTDFDLKEAVDLISAEAWEGFAKIKSDIPLVSCNSLAENTRWPLPLYPFSHSVAPPDIIEGLRGLHKNPGIWYTGQLAYYIIGRLSQSFQTFLEQTKKKIGYEHPVASVHIRRGDKIGIEAYVTQEHLYLEQVKLFYDKYPNTTERKVFLATDDANIKQKLHENWPEYKFITAPSDSSGKYFEKGYDSSGLTELLIDIFLLTEADYTVCTFSSNFCRLVHELKQVLFTDFDASDRTMSVDRTFFYFKPFDRSMLLAVESHKATSPSELSFERGDFIEDQFIKSNWKIHGKTVSHGKGMHWASGRYGRYPLWKVIDYPGEMDYPSYDFL